MSTRLTIALLLCISLLALPAMVSLADDSADKPPADMPPAEEPAAEEPPADKPDPKKPDADKPAADKPAADKPPADKSDDEKPVEPEPTAEELFADGRKALFQGKIDEAIKLLEKAAGEDPENSAYRLHLARAHRYNEDDAKATKILEAILADAPDHVEAGQTLAEIHAQAERWKDVVRVLQPLLKYRHDYPTYHLLAEAENNLGDLDKARKHYEEALKLNPDSATDHYQIANIYLAGNFFALAAESYQKALELGLEGPVLRYKLGSAMFNLRNYFGAVSVRVVKSGKPGMIHEDAYLIEPVDAEKETFLCAPANSAIYQIARALEDGIEEKADIRMLLATIYLNARRYRQAYPLFAEIAEEVPDHDQALFYYYFAQAALGTDRYQEYLDLLGKAIDRNPDAYEPTRVDAYIKVADRYNQLGDLDNYLKYLVLAITETPESASLHLKLAEGYEESRRYTEAVRQWRMVLDLEPDHPRRIELLNRIEKNRQGLPTTGTPATTSNSDTVPATPPSRPATRSDSDTVPATPPPAASQ